MKVFLALLFVALAAAESTNDGVIFDDFNILEILDNDEERLAVLACVLEEKPCGIYQPLKDKGGNVIKTRCGDCTPEQKTKFEEAIKKFETDHYDEFRQLMTKIKSAE